MPRIIEGSFDGAGLKVAIVASRFNSFIVDHLVAGAVDTLVRHGVADEAITVIKCPGAWELPALTKAAAESGAYGAVVTVGAVIRGGTPHFEHVAAEVSKGVAAIGMSVKIPVTFGVLTTDTIEQSIERAGTKAGNKGSEAALAALEMANLLRVVHGGD